MIARTWRGWVATADSDAYVTYMGETGMPAYLGAPGNLGAHMLRRDTGASPVASPAATEVLMVTFWESMAAVRAFAGEHPERAVFYPEDDRFLLARDEAATHFDVALSGGRR